MLPLITLRTGTTAADDDLTNVVNDLTKAAKRAAKEIPNVVRKVASAKKNKRAPVKSDPPPPPETTYHVVPPDPDPHPPDSGATCIDRDREGDREEQSEDETELLDAGKGPVSPVDIHLEPGVLDDTIQILEDIISGTLRYAEAKRMLVGVHNTTRRLWESVVRCYEKNQELQNKLREANQPFSPHPPPTYKPTAEPVKAPRSVQRVLTLIAAMMALLSVASPELITVVDTEPMGNADARVLTVTDPALPPGALPLPALPPPPHNGGNKALMRSKNGARRVPRRGSRPALQSQRPPDPLNPPTPTPSPHPLSRLPSSMDDDDELDIHPNGANTPTDPTWWRAYLERALLAGGVGLLGMARESARR